MCRADDANPAIILGSELYTARKPHTCQECGRIIAIGETYLRERGLADGEPFTHKTCEHCQVARDWLQRECGGFVYTEIEEELREHWHEAPSYHTRELARLIYGMKHQWRTRKGGLMSRPAQTVSGDA